MSERVKPEPQVTFRFDRYTTVTRRDMQDIIEALDVLSESSGDPNTVAAKAHAIREIIEAYQTDEWIAQTSAWCIAERATFAASDRQEPA
jgi:hypothetical protein